MLQLEIDNDRAFTDVARSWFGEFPLLAGDLWTRLEDSCPLPGLVKMVLVPGDRIGKAHGAIAVAGMRPWPGKGKKWTRTFSSRTWLQAMEKLSERPRYADLDIDSLDEEGRWFPNNETARISISAPVDDDPSQVLLVATGGGSHADLRRPEVARRWLDAIESLSESYRVVYGALEERVGTSSTTVLDESLGRTYTASMKAARTTLRGYSWVTICPPELARRLGGARTIEDSGSFTRVRELPSGAVLLRATEDISTYQPRSTALRNVFRTLAPVLPPGRPFDSSIVYQRPCLLEFDDAGRYQ